MRLVLIMPLLIAACASTPPGPSPQRRTADELEPRRAYEQAIRLRDGNQLSRAEEYLYSAAERGYAEAQFELGVWLFTCRNGREDSAEAAGWNEKAATQGHADALRLNWQLYLFGKGVPQDSARAFQWLQKAAELGDAELLYHMGLAHFDGIGTPSDPAQAAQWFQKAAEKGHGGACYYLGVMHLEGIGVVPNDTNAISWFSTGAALKHPACYLGLGDCYRDGRGTARDLDKARGWYKLVLLTSDDGELLAAATQRLNDLGP